MPPVLRLPVTKQLLGATMLATNIGNRQPRFRLLLDLDDLFLGESLLLRGFLLDQEVLA